METKREAIHAISKILVTTNPTCLSEHARISTIIPLLNNCRDTNSTDLQIFEALLALTNILSCGSAEKSTFNAEK